MAYLFQQSPSPLPIPLAQVSPAADGPNQLNPRNVTGIWIRYSSYTGIHCLTTVRWPDWLKLEEYGALGDYWLRNMCNVPAIRTRPARPNSYWSLGRSSSKFNNSNYILSGSPGEVGKYTGLCNYLISYALLTLQYCMLSEPVWVILTLNTLVTLRFIVVNWTNVWF